MKNKMFEESLRLFIFPRKVVRTYNDNEKLIIFGGGVIFLVED